jgi:hypothetical protein
MGAQLKIKFGGVVEGLAEHRLELSAFGTSIVALVTALRRVASSLVTEAVEHSSGRLAKGADLRVFLDSIGGGSVALNMDVSAPPLAFGQNGALFDELPAKATEKFVRAVEAESKGEMVSAQARKFLRSLPQGVTSQQYEVHSSGVLIYEATIGAFTLPEESEDLPVVLKTMARITGINFDPSLEVRLDADGAKLNLSANAPLIDRAISLRSELVMIVATVSGTRGRLLWLDLPDAFPAVLSPEARTNHVLSRWEKTLSELAR